MSDPRRPRIWFINQYAALPHEAGGTRHIDIGRELATHGLDVTLWVATTSHKTGRLRRAGLLGAEQVDGVTVRWIWSTPYRGNGATRALNMAVFTLMVFLVGLLAPRPDVVVGSSPHLFGATAGWALARLRRTRFFMEVRDLWPEVLVAIGLRNRPVVRVLQWLEEFLYRRAEAIIALTAGFQRRIQERGFGPVFMIPNGVRIKDWREIIPRTELRARHQWTDQFIAMYVGAFGPANALNTVVEAACSLRDVPTVRFILVGDGVERARLQARVANLGLQNVEFLGAIPRTEVPSYLAAADVVISTFLDRPDFRRYLPNKMFDAWMSNRPVICAMAGESAEWVEGTATGLSVTPEDGAALAEAVMSLYRDPELYTRLSGRGRQLVIDRFSREQHAAEYAQILGVQ